MKDTSSIVEQAKQTFRPGAAGEEPLRRLQRLLDELRVEDLDLPRRMASLDRGRGWSTEQLFAHSDFYISLFLMPRGQEIPFHGHPLMTVLMRVLWGKAQIKAYDWAEEYPWTGLARCAYDQTLDGASGTLLILPKKGNIHRVRAVDDCAFIDVLSPPYEEREGRPCHYYREEKVFTLHGEELTRLVRE